MSRSQEVLQAYEEWDPDQESSTQVAERLGISKARLYQILNEENITPKARRPRKRSLADRHTAGRQTQKERDLLDELTERGVQSLLDELEELRRQVAAYREKYGEL